MEDPIVSVIIPIYNCEQYIKPCMQSILNQSVKNIEILMIDDGSTDQSSEICDEYSTADHRVVVVHKSNGGVASARNLGIVKARGQWLMFVDADDTLETTIIEELLQTVEEDIDITICCCNVLYGNNIIIEHFYQGSRMFITDREKKDLYLQLMDLSYDQSDPAYTAVGVPWGKLYRRSFIEKYNLLFPTELKRLQDNIFNMYAFHMARSICYFNKPLYNYRYDHMANTYQKNPQEIIGNFSKFLEERQKCLTEIGETEDKDICKYANRERLIYLIRALNYGVFYPGNKASIHDQKKFAGNVVKMGCFNLLFSSAKLQDFQGWEEKIAFILLKRKYFTIFYVALVIHRSIG